MVYFIDIRDDLRTGLSLLIFSTVVVIIVPETVLREAGLAAEKAVAGCSAGRSSVPEAASSM